MVISWIDPLSICLVCVAFCDLISISVVLVLFVLTASRSLFLYMFTWMIKLILGLVNFLTNLSQTESLQRNGSCSVHSARLVPAQTGPISPHVFIFLMAVSSRGYSTMSRLICPSLWRLVRGPTAVAEARGGAGGVRRWGSV
jgi:hypothetical protein